MNKVEKLYSQIVDAHMKAETMIEKLERVSQNCPDDTMPLLVIQTLEIAFDNYNEEKLQEIIKDYNQGDVSEYVAVYELEVCKGKIAIAMSHRIKQLDKRIIRKLPGHEKCKMFLEMFIDILDDLDYGLVKEFEKGQKIDIFNRDHSRSTVYPPDGWDREEELVVTEPLFGIQDKTTKEIIAPQSVDTETLRKFKQRESGLNK